MARTMCASVMLLVAGILGVTGETIRLSASSEGANANVAFAALTASENNDEIIISELSFGGTARNLALRTNMPFSEGALMIDGNGVATPIDTSLYLISAASEDAFVVLSTNSQSGETVGVVSGLGDGETYTYSQTANGVTTLTRSAVPQRSFECGVTHHDHHIGDDSNPFDRLLSEQQNLRGTMPGDIGRRELQSKYNNSVLWFRLFISPLRSLPLSPPKPKLINKFFIHDDIQTQRHTITMSI